MRFIELIDHLKRPEKTEMLILNEIPGVEFGLVDIYLRDKLHIESEVRFFDAEAIPNKLVIEVDGIRYVNLFPLPMTQEMIEEYAKRSDQKFSDKEIAQKLLDYRIKDA